jgi:hypothetical protein
MKRRQVLMAAIAAITHMAVFLLLLGARVGPAGDTPQTLVEFVLALPLVSAVNYLPGPDLFSVAVPMNALLWGWALSSLAERFVLPLIGLGERREEAD